MVVFSNIKSLKMLSIDVILHHSVKEDAKYFPHNIDIFCLFL